MKIKNLKYFIFFPCCFLVLGAKRSLIYDPQREKLQFIPNDLYHFVLDNNKLLMTRILSNYTDDDHNIVLEYIEFLVKNEFAFIGTKKDIKVFQNINYKWSTYSKITNAIYEYSLFGKIYIKKTLIQLNLMKCNSLQIISYDVNLNLLELNSLLSDVAKFQFLSDIELIIPYNKEFDSFELEKFLNKFLIVNKLIIHSSPTDNVKRLSNNTLFCYSSKVLLNRKLCGTISDKFFSLNIKLISESIKHNSCLNRKISIDVNGNIKNCPSMPESYGNIKDTTLEEALNKPGFKKYWNVTKDMIEVCKDCEFRYVCTDCRAYTERTTFDKEEIDLSKPLKCGYNPYTNEWAEWSTNPLKQKAIEYYGMQDLVKKDA